MEPGAFIAEFYRRQDARFPQTAETYKRSWSEMSRDPAVLQGIENYRSVLPNDKRAAILDIGFGYGEFIATCVALGYAHVEGADFGAEARLGMREWSPSVRAVHNISDDIGTFLLDKEESYDFIHLSHVIEHIPKYSLFYHLDAIYRALRPGGVLFIRTPNMDGPCPVAGRYATITHETGFTGFSLHPILEGCNFDNVRYHSLSRGQLTPRQHLVKLLRSALIRSNKFMHRMFGANNRGGQYGEELVMSAQRLDRPPLFDPATH